MSYGRQSGRISLSHLETKFEVNLILVALVSSCSVLQVYIKVYGKPPRRKGQEMKESVLPGRVVLKSSYTDFCSLIIEAT